MLAERLETPEGRSATETLRLQIPVAFGSLTVSCSSATAQLQTPPSHKVDVRCSGGIRANSPLTLGYHTRDNSGGKAEWYLLG